MKNLFLLAVIAISVAGCKKNESEPEASQDFASLTKSYFDGKNELSPLIATYNGQEEYNDKLTLEMTEEFRSRQNAFYDKYLDALSTIDTADLDDEEKISYEIIKWETSIGKEFMKYPSYLTPLHQFGGVHLIMAQFAGGTSSQPFKTEKDYANFHSRMQKYAVYLDSTMLYFKKGMDQKVVLPKALTVKVISQFEEMITDKPEDNIFYSSVKLMPKEISGDAKSKIESDYAKVINDQLVPRFKKMVSFLRDEYLPASRTTSGIGALPFGREYYATLVKSETTTNMTPDEIHELGLREVARLRSEMQKVMDQVGFKGSIMEFCEHVRQKKEMMPFTHPDQVIANFKKIHETIKPNVNKLFSLQPKTPFEVRRTEAFREKTASAEYQQGDPKTGRPGIFYVPIPDVKKYNYYADEDLFLHEAIPGHHFQVALQMENEKLPDFRKYNWFGAYGEGWALYTESLGKELGLYSDPYQYFGMLSGEMLRATRLVVDTGLHSKGWTREQVIQYKMENEAEPADGIVMETERYMAIPGQALSYKIGQLKIIELRKKAEQKLGKNFDVRKFHEKVLESGVLPLALLEAKIEQWIKD